MPSRRTFLFTLTGALAGLCASRFSHAKVDPALWVAGELPPFVWKGAQGPEGYAFELFQRVTRQAELSASLHFYPWARALRMLEGGQAHAALAVTRTPDREAQFRWLFPVGRFSFAVLMHATGTEAPANVVGLRAHRVGYLRGSVVRGMLDDAGVAQAVEGKDYAELLAMLQREIVSAVIGPDAVLRTLDTRGRLRIAPLGEGQAFYAAAGPAMADGTVERLRAAYQQLVDGGTVAQLRKRHPEAFVAD